MESNPFFGAIENAWLNYQTNQGQTVDPCIGLSNDQIYKRIDQWLPDFWPNITPNTMAHNAARVGIYKKFYRD